MKWIRLTERTKDWLASLARLIVLIPMVLFGNQLRRYCHTVWIDHWLSKDAKTTHALVTQIHPKRVFDYRYSVNGKEYTGTSNRNWEDEKVHALQAREETTVFFSASHPWLSSFQTSQITWAAFPIMVLILLFELFFLAVLVDPKGRGSVSRWLLDVRSERQN